MLTRVFPLVLVSLAAFGPQSATPRGDGMRTLSGIVTDQDSRPIPQAAVLLENEKTLEVRSYLAEERGEFHFAELNPDVDYDVRAEFDGIRSAKKTLSQFDSRMHPTMTLVIRLPKRLSLN
jgi:hypothetical protein